MKQLNNYKYSYFQKQRTSNQTQELRHNIFKKDKAIVKWLSLKDQELGSDSIHKDTQTHLNMKEVLILAEYSTMNYGTLELQEALNNNTSKNAAKDSTVLAQQNTEAVTRNEAEASQKPILAPKNKVKPTQFITLWDLPKEARISQIRRCLNRYRRTSIIE
ncbi:44494_t:CDS:2 [Gigaspora margarita]|uniref:44494_t:CDS:1 n=1 Tax=Gigaspora margarita TaxID=4874 RepID=A0ABN7V3G3_GIGMA|nr:44494_t:CDS:2 [Gigaspora margarita]